MPRNDYVWVSPGKVGMGRVQIIAILFKTSNNAYSVPTKEWESRAPNVSIPQTNFKDFNCFNGAELERGKKLQEILTILTVSVSGFMTKEPKTSPKLYSLKTFL